MKRLTYEPPIVTVVEFRVEQGFQSSQQPMTLGLRHAREDFSHYSTGEDYSEFTDNGGGFSMGEWI